MYFHFALIASVSGVSSRESELSSPVSVRCCKVLENLTTRISWWFLNLVSSRPFYIIGVADV